ncbi:MAG: hypothetical protein AAGF99_14730 [Bacteroidota bacterium]
MLDARPTGLFSWDYRVYAGGREVAFLDVGLLLEGADLDIGGIPFRLDREGLAGDFTLAFEGIVIARATKRSLFTGTFDVVLDAPLAETGTTHLLVKRKSLVSDHFEVFVQGGVPDEPGARLGMIRKRNMLTRRALVDLPNTFPLGVQVFLLWLAVLMWRRGNRSS